DDRARLDHGVAAERDPVGFSLAEEARRRTRHGELGPELLGLYEGPAGQLLPGHAGREAEVVLDARARSGLAAGRARFQDEGVEALGCGVHRRRESRGSRSDDDDVAHGGGIVPERAHGEAVRDLLVRWLLQDLDAAAD